MMTLDYQIPITLSEFDNMTEKRIMRLIKLQQERLEDKNKRMEMERQMAEKEAARSAILRK